MGLRAQAHPLSEIVPLQWHMPGGAFDGILAGSANAFRQGGALLGELTGQPVYAVGASTAEAAGESGFRVAVTGKGGLQTVLDELAGQRLRLLRIAGEDHVPLDPPAGVTMATVIAYRVAALPVSPDLASSLERGAVVLLHSAAAAEHFAAEVDRLGLARCAIRLAALGQRIAAAAGPGWASVSAADEPNDPALLALARELCHEPLRG